METKFTKGPWAAKLSKYEDGVLLVQAGMPTNRVLARFGSDDEPLDEIDAANANLIASAPNLHDFAADDQWQVIMGALDKWSREGGSELVALGIIGQGLLVLDDKRRAALRAARGEQGEG